MNVMFDKEFKIEVLDNFTYSQLRHYSNTLVNAIGELEKLKTMAVLCEKDVKAVEYQRYIYNAQANREAMLVVMLAIEVDVCVVSVIETVWLNYICT